MLARMMLSGMPGCFSADHDDCGDAATLLNLASVVPSVVSALTLTTVTDDLQLVGLATKYCHSFYLVGCAGYLLLQMFPSTGQKRKAGRQSYRGLINSIAVRWNFQVPDTDTLRYLQVSVILITDCVSNERLLEPWR
jgi:hypothetical protein